MGLQPLGNKHDAQDLPHSFLTTACCGSFATGDVIRGREQLRAVAEAYLRAPTCRLSVETHMSRDSVHYRGDNWI
jgi:hypothetical protein